MRYFVFVLGAVFLLASCHHAPMEVSGEMKAEVKEEMKAAEVPPEVLREFRAAWVATVANIDWPSKPGLSTEKQKEEMLAILDKSKDLNLNAIVFQVRPQCDALYESNLEPWSFYLTGKMGKAPDPYYDPLAFAVKEAHKRGLELHVWFNPYRANHPMNKSPISDDHISKVDPPIVKKYGRYLWMDPGEEGTRDHTMNVVLDVTKRYDIDGVHIDDYFYPYKEKGEDGKIIDFPDEPSWEKYKAGGGTLSRSDWRRENVNKFVERFYNEVKEEKPWVKVGISPFGIWRPGYPPGVKGFDQYEQLYADARLWLKKGWVDYFTPQLYWSIDSEGQPYKDLLKWWTGENDMKRHIWPGNYTSRVGGRWKAEEIISQVKATREQPGAGGNVHFSMICLMENRDGLSDKLKETVYQQPALVPASPWLARGSFDKKPSLKITRKDNYLYLNWEIDEKEKIRNWVLSKRLGGVWSYKILPEEPGRAAVLELDTNEMPEIFAISAVDIYGRQSPSRCVNVKDLGL